jgi:hypothetical protein
MDGRLLLGLGKGHAFLRFVSSSCQDGKPCSEVTEY